MRASKYVVPLLTIALSAALAGPVGLGPTALMVGTIFAYLYWRHGGQIIEVAQREYQSLVLGVERAGALDKKPSEGPRNPRPLDHPATTAQTFHDEPTVVEALPVDVVEGIAFSPDMDFVLGFEKQTNTPITMKALTSLGIGGVQGSGKSVSTANIVTQAMVKFGGEARVLVIDPHMHANSPDSLASRLAPLSPFFLSSGKPDMPNPVSGGQELLNWLLWIEEKVKGRLQGQPSSEYWVIVADEFVDLVDDGMVGAKITQLLDYINSHARKVNVFAIVTSPHWESKRMAVADKKIGGTGLRNSIATFLLHRMPSAIARQMVDTEVANLSPSLRVGEAILNTFDSYKVGRVPMLSPQDIARVVRPYLPKPTPVIEPLQPALATKFVTPLSTGTPSAEEVIGIYRTYKALLEMGHEEDAAARAIAIDYYGPGELSGVSKVTEALSLGDKHAL